MWKLFARATSLLSLISMVFILFNLFKYPLSIGRAMMYMFLLIPLLLISIDLGYNEAISNWINQYLNRKRSIVVQIIIIVMVFVSVMILTINYANSLLRITSQATNIGEIYPEDIKSIWVAAVPIILYIIYYYSIKLCGHMFSKQ